jgi:predicted DNA-binding protein
MARRETEKVSVRIDKELDEFLQLKSTKIGLSKSEYVRNLIVKGATAESVVDFEDRMLAILDEMKIILGIRPDGAGQGLSPFDRLALYECLGLLRINAAKSAPGDVRQAQGFANQMLEEVQQEQGRKRDA